MTHKELARTGVQIPEVGMGTGNYRSGPLPLRQGLEAGALFIDTAESYETEDVVGQAVKGFEGRLFVATKVSPSNFRAADFRRSAEASLRRLGIDRIDLLQLHHWNSKIPIEEPMGAMSELIRAGKVRFAGVSNFSVAQLQLAQKALSEYPVVSNQVRYNLIDRTIEPELLPYCQANGITIIAYSPLARGFDRILDCDPGGILDRIASETGKTPAQIALNWCLSKERVVAIPMSNSARHVLENCGATDWRLAPEHLASLESGIQYRRRTGLDAVLRRYLPGRLRNLALATAKRMPRGLRRRFT